MDGLTGEDRVLQKTPYSFDVSVWEFFWPLVTGRGLVVARPGGHQDPDYLVRLINQAGITTMHFVPSMLQVFVEAADVESCTSLRRVVCSGEALTARWRTASSRASRRGTAPVVYNLYGPTEASVEVTGWRYDPESPLAVVRSAGRWRTPRPTCWTRICVRWRSASGGAVSWAACRSPAAISTVRR